MAWRTGYSTVKCLETRRMPAIESHLNDATLYQERGKRNIAILKLPLLGERGFEGEKQCDSLRKKRCAAVY
jgi:hypothetical protein